MTSFLPPVIPDRLGTCCEEIGRKKNEKNFFLSYLLFSSPEKCLYLITRKTKRCFFFVFNSKKCGMKDLALNDSKIDNVTLGQFFHSLQVFHTCCNWSSFTEA